MFKEMRMDTATHNLLYRSEAFAEDVLDLVAGRPVAVHAPVVASPWRTPVRTVAGLLRPDAGRSAPFGGSELPAV